MITHQSSRRLELRLLATAMLIVSLPLFAAAASAQNGAGRAFTDPGEIDRAVAEFTGVPIGEVGGARVPADRRLRLAACHGPLDLSGTATGKRPYRSPAPAPIHGESLSPPALLHRLKRRQRW